MPLPDGIYARLANALADAGAAKDVVASLETVEFVFAWIWQLQIQADATQSQLDQLIVTLTEKGILP